MGILENGSYTAAVRVRSKECQQCKTPGDVLYRCRYGEQKAWVFLCQKCLKEVKTVYGDSYQYGGTWKSQKK